MGKILVTGSKGFIGTALCAALRRSGAEIVEADLPGTDVSRPGAFDAFLGTKFARVFHLAGKTFVPDSWADPASFYGANANGTLNALEYCRKTKTPLTFVSAYIYGRPDRLPLKETSPLKPNNPYAHSKYLAESLCRFYAEQFGLRVTVLRPFNVYGPGQSPKFLIPSAVSQAAASGTIKVKDLSPRRDYVHIDDLVRALLLTLRGGAGFQVYNVASGRSYSVKQVLDIICRAAGGAKVVSSRARRRGEIPDTRGSVSKAAAGLGWKPEITLEEGLADMVTKAKENMPINKGNYSMETPQREAEFERRRGAGWENEYAAYRRNWAEYPKNHFVAPYPLLLDLELSSVCNLRCPMCYTITKEFKSKVAARLIDYALYTRILDEIGGKVPALRLSLRGEPTLHPKFFQCVEYARAKGVKEISFLTNASTLTLENFKKMAAAGVDWITVSVDGVGKTYESIRKPLKFNETLKKLKDIHLYKKKHGLLRPVIKVQSVWPAIKEDPEKYYNTFKNCCDLIAFNPLIDYLGNDSQIVYEDNFVCPQQYQRLVVGADGLAMMCSNDEENSVVVGDANKQAIRAIWHGSKLEKIRKTQLRRDGFMKIPVCRKCYLPRKTEDKETARVNGRTFIIKNYVNRAQAVGR